MPRYSSADIETLAQYLRHARDASKPFAMLTGAGCSISAGIPGAAALVEEINRELPFCLTGLSEADRGDYGKCMSCLPEHMQRSLLRKYLEKAKVNWGHIALAGMMKAGYVGRVLTFNFDNILARACGLVGRYPATYDFAAAPTDTFSHIADEAIVHLHGQGHGFFMFNSEEKTAGHAERLMPLLKEIFDRHPIIAIGYSGSSDAVFARMQTIFTGRNALFWAGRSDDAPAHVDKLLEAGGRTAHYLGGTDADRFLLELAVKLECLPSLFSDPYGHLLDELADVTNFPLTDTDSKDVLEKLRQELGAAQKEKKASGPSIADLFREGKWKEVVDRYNRKDPQEVDFAYWAQLELADGARTNILKEFNEKGVAQMNLAYGKALDIMPEGHEALYNWGNALNQVGQLTCDQAQCEKAIKLYQRALEIEPDDYDTFVSWGHALSQIGKLSKTSSLHEQAIQQYRRAVEIKPDSHDAYNNWGIAHNEIGRLSGNISDHKLAIEQYQRAIEIKPEKHEAFVNWGNALVNIGEQTKDCEKFEQAIEKYRHALEIKPDKHQALENWGAALLKLWHAKKQKDLLVEAVQILQRSENLEGKANYNLACALALIGRLKEAETKMLQCETDGTLPAVSHMLNDPDLTSLVDVPWFKELIGRRKAVEDNQSREPDRSGPQSRVPA